MSVENRKFRNIKIMWKLCSHFLSWPRKFAFHSLEMFFRLSLYIHTRPDFSWCLVFDIWDLCLCVCGGKLWKTSSKMQIACKFTRPVWFYLQNYVSVEMIWYITCPITFPHYQWAHVQITLTRKPNVRDLFLPFLRGSSLGLHDHKKVRGSNIYYEMLNHGERGALFDLWGCAIVPYNPQ